MTDKKFNLGDEVMTTASEFGARTFGKVSAIHLAVDGEITYSIREEGKGYSHDIHFSRLHKVRKKNKEKIIEIIKDIEKSFYKELKEFESKRRKLFDEEIQKAVAKFEY